MPQSRMATPTEMIQAHITWLRAGRGRWADSTIRQAGQVLRRLHRELPAGLHRALPEELALWLGNPAWAEQSVATYYKHIVRFYRWAAGGRDPWLSYDPSAELPRPNAKPGLPRPAAEAVARTAIFDLPEPWRLCCRLVALAGLRPAEVATLRREDITEQVITVKGKGGKSRAVPTHPLIWQTVWSRPPGPLVPRRSGRPADAQYVSKTGARTLRNAGLPITLYALRHYFGTAVTEQYRDIRVTQELMGHASIQTTTIYTQVTDVRKREAVNSLPFAVASLAGPGPTAAE